MKLFSNNIVPYASIEGDKIYPIVVDIKKGIKSGEAISFVTADNQVGVITVDFMDGNSSYSIEGCMVTSTIHRPDGTVLEIPCDIISQSTIEIPLGINGTYQEGVHTFDIKIVRGNGKVIGVPTMSYSVSGSLSSDEVVEGDDRLPVLTMVLDNAQDKLNRLDKAIAGATNDLEVREARDGEVTLNARLERDLAKGKVHFVDVAGSSISTESQEGYLENVKIYGNTWQDANNLSDIRSVGTKVEGQELYEIPVLSVGKNLWNGVLKGGDIGNDTGLGRPVSGHAIPTDYVKCPSNTNIVISYTLVASSKWLVVYEYDKDKNYLGYTEASKLTTKPNTRYIKFKIENSANIDIKDLMIEVGTQATPYEPYQEDKLAILSPTPLEKVGDIADRIICKEGVWGVEKNVINLTFTGIENWRIDTNGTFYMSSSEWKGVPHKPNCVCITDIFASAMNNNDINDKMFMGNSYLFMIKPSGIASVNEWKSYLNANNLKVKYATTQPTFIPLPHDQQIKLRTFADRTNIHFETEIEPTLKAQVPKSLGATVNTHTTQIDNLNKELDRVKKLEESTVSTVTSDKAFTTVAETTQGYFEDVKIEGKTLVNLFNNTLKTGKSCLTIDKIKEDVNYTIVVNTNNFTGQLNCQLSTDNINYTSDHEIVRPTENNTSTVVKKLAKTGGGGLTVMNYGLYLLNHTQGNVKILILEGDHTDKDITYFEGLKSVGQGVDEIEILSRNKNEINLAERTYYLENASFASYGGKDIEIPILGRTISYRYDYEIISISEEQEYFYTNLASSNYSHPNDAKMDLDKTKINNRLYNGAKGTVVVNNINQPVSHTLKDIRCIRTEERVNMVVKITNFALYFSDNANSYIPYSLNKKEILYYNPNTQTWEKPVLREWDSIEKHSDGKYYYHKRSSEVVLNGSESWNIRADLDRDNSSLFTLNISNGFGGSNDTNCISNRFIATTSIYSNDTEGFYRNAGYIYIRINKSKLSTQDAQGFKTWLQANPVTVVYQLAKEEVYECTNLDLITYSGETNLIVNSGAIQPRITLKVLSNVSNVIKLLQEKVSVLENKFIEGLKQVLSGNMMALAHLLYPEDFENNHEIQTLEL